MRIGFLLAGAFFFSGLLMAQSSDRMTRREYFETYKDMAIHEMRRSGVPASITLAQGALESGDGNSTLAKRANNHFGIKCHNDWTGKKVYQDDDAKNECFRKYASAEDSYRDHSDYLKAKSRYAFLFELDITDYKGWAKGLKKAGYATNPAYAEKLIDIIEEFDLHRYDRNSEIAKAPRTRSTSHPNRVPTRSILERNRVKYVVAASGDTYESLTDEFGKMSWEIPGYNDIAKPDSLAAGQIIYLQPKRNKAELGRNTHTVKAGETMYTISQLYAIKLPRLYLMNDMSPGTRPSVGTVLQLRKPVKRKVQKPLLKEADEAKSGEEEFRIDLNME
ncbi:MAG: glucosaminidase domain-containing protein [Bacteroidales bacterium]|nr:glucosaminidase domain-containing protein [Bacteroidales bacterium]